VDALLGLEHPQSLSPVIAGTLALVGLTRRFGDYAAVNAVSLELPAGELLALVGASGSGKTTTLRMVAGYEPPDAGSVLLDGSDITMLPPQKRGFGMVFQHYALFPHMPVGENVAFGLEARGIGRRERMARAQQVLENVGLGGAVRRQVQSLSGGEQQRVALARALVIEPRVLLLDEPLSNLDPTLRSSMRTELRATLRRLGVTSLFVTHDQEDAFAIADRVAVIKAGRLLQVGTPEELYDRPISRDVAEFIGTSSLVPATRDGDGVLITLGGETRRHRAYWNGSARDGLAVLRPDALALSPDPTAEGWRGEVISRRFAGALLAYRVRVGTDSGAVELDLISGERQLSVGDRVSVRVARDPVPVVPA
jgi:putative spermidine/putrescine transport system ATP-binding protein